MIPERRRAAVVAIGDELLTGVTTDRNSAEIAGRLLELGIETERIAVVGDDEGQLETLFYELCRDFPIVVSTGGLGPTLDDVTRSAAARAGGVPLVRSEEAEAAVRAYFDARGRDMPAANLRQADFPAGAQVIPNRVGTAPGFRVWIDGGMLACLPGPPREMRVLLDEELLPWLERTCGRVEAISVHRFHLMGLGESDFGERAGEWMRRDAVPRMGVTSHTGILTVTLTARAGTREGADAGLRARVEEFRARFADHVYSETDARPEVAVAAALRAAGRTVATAESCTGGLVAEMLTRVPGVSASFLGGWVTYANSMKEGQLGVEPALLERFGAVSEPVAAAMAAGAAARSGADLAVSTTGVAGPEGGTEAKPVGTVCFGLWDRGEVVTRALRFPPVDRDSVRLFAAHAALDLVRRHLPAPPPADD